MMGHVQYRGNQAGNEPNLGRTPSPFIWADCPWDEIVLGIRDGITFFDDFLTPYLTVPTSQGVYPPWKGFTSTGGTILPATPEWGGVITLGSDGDDEGASIQTVGLPIKISRSNGKFWFEARVKFDTIANTQYDAFVGLGDQMTLSATVPITATAGAMADENWVGFHRLGTDGDYVDCAYKADGVTAVYVKGDAQVLVASEWIKLGMVFDPKDNYLRWYANGVEIASKLIPTAAGTDFPNDVLMGPLIAVLNAGAITSVFSVDWVRYAQLGV